jgi:predicted nucleic acid-binding protein
LIVYLDTSSLIKLYVEESGSRDIESLVAEASLVCTSVVTYPEARSALARLCREGNLTVAEHALTKANLEEDWPGYLALEITPDVWRAAGDLAEKHAPPRVRQSPPRHPSLIWPMKGSMSRCDFPPSTDD